MKPFGRILLACLVIYCAWRFVLPAGFLWMGARSDMNRMPMLAKIDWDEKGIDPNQPGIKPEVVVLAGTYYGAPVTGMYPLSAASGEFEIIMRGYDLYWRREFRRETYWSWNAEMVCTNFYGQKGTRNRGHSVGGGGTGGFEDEDRLVVARRLWQGTNFVGAVNSNLSVQSKLHNHWSVSENFSDLQRVGAFQVPRKIIFDRWDGRQWTYTINKVVFRSTPDEHWFISERDRLFRGLASQPEIRITNQVGADPTTNFNLPSSP